MIIFDKYKLRLREATKYELIAHTLNKKRKKLKFSYKQLSKESCISVRDLKRYFNGNLILHPVEFTRICNCLGEDSIKIWY